MVYVRDTQASITSLVSIGVTGGSALGSSFQARISGDGRVGDIVFVRESTGTTEAVLAGRRPDGLQGVGQSVDSSISANGEVIAFVSSASNLVEEVSRI